MSTNDPAESLAAQRDNFAALANADDVEARLLDAVGCGLAAFESRPGVLSRILKVYADAGFGPASLWNGPAVTTVETAAMINGVAVRSLDLNDTHIGQGIVHPSDCIPALVALAEATGSTWDELVVAVSLAYDLICRLNETVDLRERGWEGATLSPIGVAFGGSSLVDLGQETTAHALRLAAMEAASLRCGRVGSLSDWKAISSPRAAARGLFALRLAQAGVDGPPGAFSGPDGLVDVVTGPIDLEPDPPSLVGNTLIKRYPAQIFIQSPLALALRARSSSIPDPSRISAVAVSTFARAVGLVGGIHMPSDSASADHNLRFCLASALVNGGFDVGDVETSLSDERVARLFSRIEVSEDPAATSRFPHEFLVRIEIQLDDGTVLVEEADRPDGDAGAIARKLPATTETWPFKIEGAPALLRQKGSN